MSVAVRPRLASGAASAVLIMIVTTVFVYRAEPQSPSGPEAPASFPTEGPYHYRVEYLGIACGHMTLESHLEEFDNRPAYHVVMTACNSKFFNKIYRVDGRIDSWVDAKTMSTLAYESDITEKGRRKIRSYSIDYEKGVVRADKYGKVKTVPYEGEAALDPLAYVFRGRMLAGGPGSTFELNILTDRGVTETGTQVGELKRFDTADGKKDLDPGVTRKLYRLNFKLPFGRLHANYTGPADGPVDRRTEAEKAGAGPATEEEPEEPN